MSERLLKLGVPKEYFAHAKHFAGVFKDLGWKQPQIDAAIKWGAEFKGTPEDMRSQFSHIAEQHGIQNVDIDLAASWREQVNEKGIENMPAASAQASSPQADAARKKEIEAELRKPKADSEYWKDPAMRDEYRELIERMGDGDGEYTPTPSNDSARRVEIEALMKSDRAAYFRSGADKEYIGILQRESGETPDAQPETTPEGSDDAETP